MKKLLVMFLFLIMIAGTLSAQVKVMEFVTFPYPPFMGKSGVSEDGLLIDLVKEALLTQNIQLKISYAPTKRAMATFLENEVPAYIGLVDNFSQADRAIIDNIKLVPIRFMCFYLSKTFPNSFTFDTYQDLKSYSIGVMVGGLTEKIAIENKLNYDSAPDIDAVFKKLILNRNQVGVAVDLSINNYIAEKGKASENLFSVHKKPFIVAQSSLLLNKKNPQYAVYSEKILSGLKAIAQNGTWLRVLELYYGKGNAPSEALQNLASYK